MTLADIECSVSGTITRILAKPRYGLFGYALVRVTMWWFMTTNRITLILSDASMILLLIMLADQVRQADKVERHVEELVKADPKIDETKI